MFTFLGGTNSSINFLEIYQLVTENMENLKFENVV